MVRISPSITLLRTQSDERLVRLAREGSDAAFSTIFERHRRVVLGACRRILPEARAEDAVQQVFLSAWAALVRGDEVRDVRPWLLRIARNTALNALRVQGYDYDELRDGLRVGSAPDEELERRDVIRQTLAGLAALPERQREVLLRSAVEGVAHADIARDLGLSEGATRQLMLRARTTLRAAASAITPWPVLAWAAGSTGGGAAATATGAGALAAKAGVVAVIAGGAVAGPAIIRHRSDAPAPRATAAAAATARSAEAEPQPAAGAIPVADGGRHDGHPARDDSSHRRRGTSQRRRGANRASGHDGPGSGSGGSRDGDDDRAPSAERHHGSGSDDSRRGSGRKRSGGSGDSTLDEAETETDPTTSGRSGPDDDASHVSGDSEESADLDSSGPGAGETESGTSGSSGSGSGENPDGEPEIESDTSGKDRLDSTP